MCVLIQCTPRTCVPVKYMPTAENKNAWLGGPLICALENLWWHRSRLRAGHQPLAVPPSRGSAFDLSCTSVKARHAAKPTSKRDQANKGYNDT